MHASVMEFVKYHVGHLDAPDVLDVGSLDVNGSVREVMPEGARVTGIDLRAGPGVNRVLGAADIPNAFAPASFDVVTCCEMLEHDPTPWLTVEACAWVLKPEGLLLLTARGVESAHCQITDRPHAFGAHGEPDDWWRYMAGTLSLLCRQVGLAVVEEVEDTQAPGWFCAAVKP